MMTDLNLLVLLDFWLDVHSHFSKQIEETIQYDEKSNGLSHLGPKEMLILESPYKLYFF